MSRAKSAFLSTLYVAPEERREMEHIPESDEQTARACHLAGHLPQLPPVARAHGVGAAVPDRGFRHYSPFVDS